MSSSSLAEWYTPDDMDIPPREVTTIVHPLDNEHTHTVIFLHGREDYGEYLSEDFFLSKSSSDRSLAEIFPTFKWVFPTAGKRTSARRLHEFSSSSFAKSLEGHEVISQWFDIWDVSTPDCKQELMVSGLRESVAQIIEIIKEESTGSGVPLERIIIGGISQGCAVAVQVLLLLSGIRLGGFIGICSFLPFENDLKNVFETENDNTLRQKLRTILGIVDGDENFEVQRGGGVQNETPVFIAHSKPDDTVPFEHGYSLQQNLKTFGYDVTWKGYEDGRHWIHDEHGVDDIACFIKRVLAL